MKKFIKVGSVALAIAMSVPAFAEEAEVEDEGAIGWTPIAIGVFSPVQIPWGSARWDVFGIDLGILWADAPKMYGLGVSGIAMATRDDMMGVQVSGLCNWASKDVYGLRATIGANITFGDTYGVDAGMFAYREGEFWGWDTNFLGNYGEKGLWGVALAGLLNLNMEQSYGFTCAIGGNMAPKAYGLQLAGIFNFTDELHGFQVGLVNFARTCPWGLQLGLVNVIMDNQIKVLPLVNLYF